MIRFIGLGAVAVALSCAISLPTHAQRNYLNSLYGSGVHFFFSGDFFSAQSAFDQALGLGSRDPRVYYFRGLTKMRMGDSAGAMADFEAGAMVEAGGAGRSLAIGRSLQRIQGGERMQLEQARARARLMAQQQRVDANRLRYGDQAPGQPMGAQIAPQTPGVGEPNLPDVSDVDDPTTPFSGGTDQPRTDQPMTDPPVPDSVDDTPDPQDQPSDPPAEDPDDNPFGGDDDT